MVSNQITWRDLIIPAGITFEELHMIIQILMDLCNCHLYMFESKTGIERIVDFDFINDWEFTIEIKKKVEIDSYYPQLKRFKGDYGPVEDCGGPWRLGELISLKTGEIPMSEANEWEEIALEYMEKFDLEDV